MTVFEELAKNLAAVFGSEPLTTWSSQSLERSGIPRRDQEFLQTIGLPSVENIFSPGGDQLSELPPVSDIDDVDVIDGESFRTIGTGNGLYICIRTAPIGKVWAVTPSERTTIQLVNSSVAHFATFLLTYEQRIARAAPSSAEEALQIIESTAALLASIDPDAMVPDDGNIWSVEFETLKDIC